MVVLTLVKRSNTELIAVLKGLLARAEAGKLDSMAACLRDSSGGEYLCLTGAYRSPGAASHAAFLLQCGTIDSAFVP